MGEKSIRENKAIFVVLGMHRSGTSAVMNAISMLGVNIGDEILPPGFDNPKGFFEDNDIVKFNNQMLNELGLEWWSLKEICNQDVDLLVKRGYLRDAKLLLNKKLSTSTTFGFKDPRVSKLFLFWKKLFNELNYPVHYVYCIRNPRSVAQSLNKRNGLEIRLGYLLWLSYSFSVVSSFDVLPSIIVDYDALMTNPARCLDSIALSLGLVYDKNTKTKSINEFIDHSLRHSAYDLKDLHEDTCCPIEVIEVWQAIKHLENIESLKKLKDHIAVSRRVLAREFDDFDSLLKRIDKKEKALLVYRSELAAIQHLPETVAQKDKQIIEQQNIIYDVSEWGRQLSLDVVVRDNTILALNEKIEQVSNWANQLCVDIGLRDGEIVNLKTSVDELSAWGSGLHESIQDRDNTILALNEKIEQVSNWANQLSVDIGLRDGEIVNLKTSVDELSAWGSGLHESIQDRDNTILVLNEKIEQVSNWANQLSVDIGLRDGEIVNLKTSVDELSAWGSGLHENIQDRDNTILALNEKIEQVSNWANQLSVDIGLRDGEIVNLKTSVDELSAWGAGLNENILSLNYENEALSEKLLSSNEENKSLSASLNTLNMEFEATRNELNEVTMVLNDIYSRIAETEKENQRITMELDSSKSFAVRLETQNAQNVVHYEKLIGDLEKKVEDTTAQLHSKQNELMSISAWAKSIHEKPITYGIKKHVLRFFRLASRGLSAPYKQKIKSFLQRKPYAPDVSALRGQLAGSLASQGASGSITTFAEKDVFVFAVIDWHFRIQRPQHIAKGLARSGKRVFYFSNHFCDSATPGYQIEKLDENLELYQVKLNITGAPAIYFAPPTEEAQKMLNASMAVFISEQNSLGSISVLQHAYWYDLAKKLPNSITTYDCMDHHEGFGNVPEELINIEKNMLKESDLLIVTSSWLEDFAKDYNNNFITVRNACEYEHFSTAPEAQYTDTENRKIIGYYGAIAEWFDVDLLRDIALHFKDCLVLMVGADTANVASQVTDLNNIIFTGEVPYTELPYYLYSFDVCLLPFKVIPLTLATNPVKVYEYLSAGKPVVCVDLPEIKQFGDLVYKAASSSEFLRGIGYALSSASSTPKLIAARKKFASEQTWDHRAAAINKALANLSLPKVSVIVLTYNNLDLTKACLESLYKYSMYPNLEIIIVDNASTDETPEFLMEFAKQQPGAKIILNEQNLGFSAGNNVGLKAATGDYLVILNNDTYVTPGWVLTLMNHLRNDDSIGIIGPVTNNIGNEAKVDIHYDTMDNMQIQARAYTLSHLGEKILISTTAFFCVMLPRSTLEAVGVMDEQFGRGFFEDDDYCRRIEKINKKVACADDVFIHHHLSASFNKLGAEVKQKLFEDNKAYYEAKWGAWVPHKYRS